MNNNDINARKQIDIDFSGKDFSNSVFESFDFHESVFNGSYFTDIQFINCNLAHTEYTEAKFTNCVFINCDLNYSDFVYSQLEEVKFDNCKFAHIEWRESTFYKVGFLKCEFKNSTISLCSYIDSSFDNFSSSNFCGLSKRFNVFCRTNFVLSEDQIEFLKNNYGIVIKNAQAEIGSIDNGDPLLMLSVLKYTDKLDTRRFIDLALQTVSMLVESKHKSHVQKIKYLALIVKTTVGEKVISIFAQHYLIQSLNTICKNVTDTTTFMEIVDLIMFLKTNQYREILQIEIELAPYKQIYVKSIACEFHLANTYAREDVENYSRLMGNYLNLPSTDIHITHYRTGSTVFEIIAKGSLSVGSILLFINFSLSQLSKTFQHVSKIKKDIKYLLGKEKDVQGKKAETQSMILAPISIMINEGNENYYQIDHAVTKSGKDAIKMDGKGVVNLVISKNARLAERA